MVASGQVRWGLDCLLTCRLKSVFCKLLFLQWEHKVEKGEEDFEKISNVIQKEMARFEVWKN